MASKTPPQRPKPGSKAGASKFKSKASPDVDAARRTAEETAERVLADPEAAYEEEYDRAYRELGHGGVLLSGKTGVGKSSLVNAIFREDLAATGTGQPVTSLFEKFWRDDFPVSVYDTPGVELGEEWEAVAAQFTELINKGIDQDDPEERIHVAWFCLHADGSRIESYEIELIKEFAAHVPVIVVLTQSMGPTDQRASELAGEVERLELPIRGIVKTLALPRTIHLPEGPRELPAFGLKDLVDLTNDVLPEGVARAFINAQGVDLELKARAAGSRIPYYTGVAAGIGATPIPFADAALLVPLQLGMLADITAIFGLDVSRTQLAGLIGTVVARGGVSEAGKLMVGRLAKLIPVAGTVLGGAINATVAAAMTGALGLAYVAVSHEMAKAEIAGSPMAAEELSKQVLTHYKEALKGKDWK